MRIVFFGTAEFGVPTLAALARGHEVAAAVTGPDKPRGRGLKPAPTPIRRAAESLDIPVLTPANLKDGRFLDELQAIGTECFFVVAFRILPSAVFTMPLRGAVNLHASLLPDYRGAAPINRALINGDAETGLTTFYIEESVDTGDIILRERIAIDPDETAGDLHDRMMIAGADLAARTAALVENGTAPRIPQPLTGGRPAPKLRREDAAIDWTHDARTVHNRIRGLSPVPGAFVQTAEGPLKFLRTTVADETATPQAAPGTIVTADPRGGFTVSCGRGLVRVREVQPPGKRPMDAAAFVRGRNIEPGMKVSGL